MLEVEVPDQKNIELKWGDERVNKIYTAYHRGLFSDQEKHSLVVDVWSKVKSDIEELVKGTLTPGKDLHYMIES